MACADDVDALIAKGDQCDKRLETKEALENYLPATKVEPNNPALLVRVARE